MPMSCSPYDHAHCPYTPKHAGSGLVITVYIHIHLSTMHNSIRPKPYMLATVANLYMSKRIEGSDYAPSFDSQSNLLSLSLDKMVYARTTLDT